MTPTEPTAGRDALIRDMLSLWPKMRTPGLQRVVREAGQMLEADAALADRVRALEAALAEIEAKACDSATGRDAMITEIARAALRSGAKEEK